MQRCLKVSVFKVNEISWANRIHEQVNLEHMNGEYRYCLNMRPEYSSYNPLKCHFFHYLHYKSLVKFLKRYFKSQYQNVVFLVKLKCSHFEPFWNRSTINKLNHCPLRKWFHLNGPKFRIMPQSTQHFILFFNYDYNPEIHVKNKPSL